MYIRRTDHTRYLLLYSACNRDVLIGGTELFSELSMAGPELSMAGPELFEKVHELSHSAELCSQSS